MTLLSVQLLNVRCRVSAQESTAPALAFARVVLASKDLSRRAALNGLLRSSLTPVYA